MVDLIIIPGFGGSGPTHWQSRWQETYPSTRRLQPESWDAPDLDDWIAALELAVGACDRPPVLVAHSLGCLLVAFWQQKSSLAAAGAFLVAVPDPATEGFVETTPSFAKVPVTPLRFPSLIVCSTDDPYDTNGYAMTKAEQWRSDLCSVGNLGHINGQSGLGEWQFGQNLLQALIDKVSR
jgi:predicted alpha/beta hydrolase family esterase